MWIRMPLVAALVGVSLTGCVTTHTCVSWFDFETPQDVYDDAGLAVRGTVDAVVGTRDVFATTTAIRSTPTGRSSCSC